MRLRFLFLIAALVLAGTARAQAPAVFDTTGGRYQRPIFPNVTVTRGVTFGAAPRFSGANQTLLFDFYEPTGDVAPQRPLIEIGRAHV